MLSIKVLADSHTLVLILRNGEIATLPLDDIDDGAPMVRPSTAL